MSADAPPGSFLAGLDPDARGELLARGAARRYRTGMILFREGERSDHVVLLRSGRVKVSSYTPAGGEVVLALRGPGDILGEYSALDRRPRSATVTAVEPTEGHVIPGPAFSDYLDQQPTIATELLRGVLSQLRDSDRKRIEFGALDAAGRLASRLLELGARYGSVGERGLEISLPLTQEELAAWIGASREAVAKALRTLRDQGVIETGRKHVTILDLDALRRRLSDLP